MGLLPRRGVHKKAKIRAVKSESSTLLVFDEYFLQVAFTTRNLFIVNLAMCDLLLCVITMPTVMADLSTLAWHLGPEMVGKHCIE